MVDSNMGSGQSFITCYQSVESDRDINVINGSESPKTATTDQINQQLVDGTKFISESSDRNAINAVQMECLRMETVGVEESVANVHCAQPPPTPNSGIEIEGEHFNVKCAQDIDPDEVMKKLANMLETIPSSNLFAQTGAETESDPDEQLGLYLESFELPTTSLAEQAALKGRNMARQREANQLHLLHRQSISEMSGENIVTESYTYGGAAQNSAPKAECCEVVLPTTGAVDIADEHAPPLQARSHTESSDKLLPLFSSIDCLSQAATSTEGESAAGTLFFQSPLALRSAAKRDINNMVSKPAQTYSYADKVMPGFGLSVDTQFSSVNILQTRRNTAAFMLEQRDLGDLRDDVSEGNASIAESQASTINIQAGSPFSDNTSLVSLPSVHSRRGPTQTVYQTSGASTLTAGNVVSLVAQQLQRVADKQKLVHETLSQTLKPAETMALPRSQELKKLDQEDEEARTRIATYMPVHPFHAPALTTPLSASDLNLRSGSSVPGSTNDVTLHTPPHVELSKVEESAQNNDISRKLSMASVSSASTYASGSTYSGSEYAAMDATQRTSSGTQLDSSIINLRVTAGKKKMTIVRRLKKTTAAMLRGIGAVPAKSTRMSSNPSNVTTQQADSSPSTIAPEINPATPSPPLANTSSIHTSSSHFELLTGDPSRAEVHLARKAILVEVPVLQHAAPLWV